MGPKFKHEVHLCVCFIYLEVVLHSIFSVLAFYQTVSVKPGMEFSTCGVSCWCSEGFGFGTLDFWVRDAQSAFR